MSIFYGGTIITVDSNQPVVEAIAIEGEKIVATGSFDELKQKIGNDARLINLEGNTMIPGFIESHMHPITLIFSFLNVDLSTCKSLKEVQDKIIDLHIKASDEFKKAYRMKRTHNKCYIITKCLVIKGTKTWANTI